MQNELEAGLVCGQAGYYRGYDESYKPLTGGHIGFRFRVQGLESKLLRGGYINVYFIGFRAQGLGSELLKKGVE